MQRRYHKHNHDGHMTTRFSKNMHHTLGGYCWLHQQENKILPARSYGSSLCFQKSEFSFDTIKEIFSETT